MVYEGTLSKMQTEYADPVQYFLVFENDFINMNQLLDKTIRLEWLGEQCLSCKDYKPVFRQGFCKKCFFEQPLAGDWIMKPELSKAHLDIEDRDLDYEKRVQLQPHIVYLANSSNVKVGVTRKQQVPTRWIDQGAHEALEIVETPNRYLAGITEVALKAHISDKTNWRKMLSNDVEEVDLMAVKDQLEAYIPSEAKDYFLSAREALHIQFPVHHYPQKPKPLNLKTEGVYQGELSGIKGQYLIFKDDTVYNIRSNEGTVTRITIN